MSMPIGLNDLAEQLSSGAAGGLVEVEGPIDVEAARAAAKGAGARFTDLGGPTTKAELLAKIATGLDLPGWFGHNWDALDEVLAAPEQPLVGPILITWPYPRRLDDADPEAGRMFRSVIEWAAARRRERGHGTLLVITPRAETEQLFGLSLSRPGRVHHVAIVVRDIEQSLAFYRDRLGLLVELVLPIESDGVTIAFLTVGESKIELVQPTNPSTGVARFLESRGEGFHHVCLEVADIAVELDRLAGEGVELIDTKPRPGAEGPVAFIHPRSCNGVLVELIEVAGGPAWKALGLSG